MSTASECAWKARTSGLLRIAPFYAHILSQCRYHFVPEGRGVKWACIVPGTSGNFHLFLNRHRYPELTIEEQIGLQAHEAGHVIVNDWARRQGRDAKLWNIATDLRINGDLVKDTRMGPDYLPAGSYIPGEEPVADLATTLTCEQYYEALKDRALDLSAFVLDTHIPEELLKQLGKELDGDTITRTPEIIDLAVKRVIEQALEMTPGRGNVPHEVLLTLQQIRYQEFHFAGKLRQFMQDHLGRMKFPSWRRPNRRFAYLPGRKRGRGLKAVMVKDTSSSMGEDIREIVCGHIVNICQTLDSELIVIENDAETHSHWTYRGHRDNERLKQETGGGGTTFSPAFAYIKEHRLKPSCVLLFTDGWGESNLTEPPDAPVLWCIPSDRGPLSVHHPPGEILVLPPVDKENVGCLNMKSPSGGRWPKGANHRPFS